jgi:hypothetical protein
VGLVYDRRGLLGVMTVRPGVTGVLQYEALSPSHIPTSGQDKYDFG